MTTVSMRSAAIAFGASVLAACGGEAAPDHSLLSSLGTPGDADAAGVFYSPSGEEIGHIAASQGPRGIVLRVDLKGLDEGWHAVHLHETGDCSDGADGFQASGGHVNPDGNDHGLLNPAGAERADFPNIYAGADGRATAELYADGVALSPSDAGAGESLYPLLDDDGFAVIVHENADDHQTQPIGGAAARVACASLSN